MTSQLFNQEKNSSEYPDNNRSGVIICYIIIFIGVFLQKIAIPGTKGSLPVSTVILPLVVFWGWGTGILRLSTSSFITYSIFLLCVSMSFFANLETENLSILSLLLICVVQSCFLFKPEIGRGFSVGPILYREVMAALSLLGILQFLSQGVLGPEIAFFVDYNIPSAFLLSAYNNLNELYYGSSIFKSNGIFFAEPAFFSQFVGLAAVIELNTRQRAIRLLIYAVAILCSYSGTGIITIVIFGGYWAIKRGLVVSIIGIALISIFLVMFGSAFEIQAITSRFNEFSTPNSSGHARFISAFALIDKFTFNSISAAIVGRGPGAIYMYYDKMPFAMFDPTWARLLFEYGFVGSISYSAYLIYSFKSSDKTVLYPLVLTYLFFGGYLINTSLIALVIILGLYNTKLDLKNNVV